MIIGGRLGVTGSLLKSMHVHISILNGSKARYIITDIECLVKHIKMIFVNLNAMQRKLFYKECK